MACDGRAGARLETPCCTAGETQSATERFFWFWWPLCNVAKASRFQVKNCSFDVMWSHISSKTLIEVIEIVQIQWQRFSKDLWRYCEFWTHSDCGESNCERFVRQPRIVPRSWRLLRSLESSRTWIGCGQVVRKQVDPRMLCILDDILERNVTMWCYVNSYHVSNASTSVA